jgi:hypothetical protein
MPKADELKKALGMKGGNGGDGGDQGDHGGGGEQEGGDPEQQKLEQEARDAGATMHHEPDPGLPADVVRRTMQRDGYRCVVCHTKDGLTVHHVRHTNEEGDAANSPEDLNTVCTTDHDGLHGLQDEALKREGNSGAKDENFSGPGAEGEDEGNHEEGAEEHEDDEGGGGDDGGGGE